MLTPCPHADAVPEFISQRRRWLNGAFFAAVYSLIHFRQIWSTDHTVTRKILLHIEFVYQFISLLFTYFSLANFYLTFYFIAGSLGDPRIDPFGLRGRDVHRLEDRRGLTSLSSWMTGDRAHAHSPVSSRLARTSATVRLPVSPRTGLPADYAADISPSCSAQPRPLDQVASSAISAFRKTARAAAGR